MFFAGIGRRYLFNRHVLCALWITVVTMATGQNKVARIVNSQETIRTAVGHTISLNCEVENTENRAVQWWYVEHNLQISNNNQILTTSYKEDHFQIIHPEGGDFPHWNLQISGVMGPDAGHYRCQIEGSAASIISRVIVENDPKAAEWPEEVSVVNFTDCCRQENVSAACMPVCNRGLSNTSSFQPSLCLGDLLKLLKCGSDGRNHAGCCRHRLLPVRCLDFCVNQPPAILTDDLQVCLDKATDIIACFEHGQVLLPSVPQMVRVTALTSHSLYIKWEKPLENWNKASGYRVFSKKTTQAHYNSTDIIDDVQYILDDLQPSTSYDVYVVAVNGHGSSLPSYVVETRTLPSISLNPNTENGGFSECCQRQWVSEHCQTHLCSGQSMQTSGAGVSTCLPEMDKIFTCMTGERNHTECCLRRSVPERCHSICAGRLRKADIESLECFTTFMPDIVSCFEEGKNTLPGPPSNLVLTEVDDTTATIVWEPPTSNADKVRAYMILYRQTDGVTVQVTTPSLKFNLTGLEPSTQYEVSVAAVNDHGSSLPTPKIIFLTYYKDGQITMSSQPTSSSQGPPLSLQECCDAEKVATECRVLCTLNTSYTDFDVDLLLRCEKDIGKALWCAASGSNQTHCCQRRNVPDLCLSFCAFDRDLVNSFSFDYEHIACVYVSSTIQQCMSEGLRTHPTWPEGVYVQNYTTHTISLSWREPTRKGSNGTISQYIIRYRKTQLEQLWKEVAVPGSRLAYILQNLESHQSYQVQVLAASSEGARSLPGDTFEVTTLPVKVPPPALLPNLNFTAPADITACCKKEGVKLACVTACDGYTVTRIEQTCATDLDKLLRCSADNRDHRPCCQTNNVPEECLGFCVGDGRIQHFVSMLCLSFSQEILTCFHEGYENLPSSPVDFRLQDIGANYLVLNWDSPKNGDDSIVYDLFYRRTGDAAFTNIEEVKPPYRLESLQPFTTYQVFVVAENTYGNSRPTPTIDVWTLEERLPEVHVWQVPEGNIQENTDVTLTCISDSEPFVRLYWINNRGREVTADGILHIMAATRDDIGRYTCIGVDHERNRVSKDLYLHVMYGPDVQAVERVVSVEPDRGLTARLVCEIRGFPEHVTWLKHGVPITPAFPHNYRYHRSLTTNEDTGVMTARLEIQAVQLVDYDTYICRGTSDVGRHQALIQLVNPRPSPTSPSFTPAPKQTNVTACCVQRGVLPVCMPACTFDVDITIIETLPNPLVCVRDLTHFVQCAADGRNHTKCCRRRQVPSECFTYCSGVVPAMPGPQDVPCLQSVSHIVTCMEEGAEYVPTAPRNVKAELTVDGYIRVWWDPPVSNADKLQNYMIFYRSGNGDSQTKTVDAMERHIVLSSIHSNTHYEIFVESHNHHGSSQPSNDVTVVTQTFSPSAPRNLKGHLVGATSIRLDWEPPAMHPGSVIHYKVYFRPIGPTTWRNETVKYVRTTYRVDHLLVETRYQMKVTATSSTHESLASNVIIIKTGPPETTFKNPQPRTSDGHVGLGVGVFIAIFALLLATGIGAFLYFRNIRTKKSNGSAYKESVSFENPGYATAAEARVSGLPNYDPTNPSAGRDGLVSPTDVDLKEPAIMRETDAHSDQGYATLSPSAEPTPTSTPGSHTATLDVTQLNPAESGHGDQG